jgi:hypothetical protein
MMPKSRPSMRACTRPTAIVLFYACITLNGYVLAQEEAEKSKPTSSTTQLSTKEPGKSEKTTQPANLIAPLESNGSPLRDVTPEQQMQIESLIDNLSAPKFSQRESAASELLNIGVSALPDLRNQVELADDEESRVRIQELIEQLMDGQIEVKIQDFMAMKDVQFEGWQEILNILGNDTIATRSLFVEILRKYPSLPPAMRRELKARDRNIALENVIAAVQQTQFKQMPTTADAFALLIPLLDPNVEMPVACETLVVRVMQSATGTKIRKDKRLSPIFKYLLGQWMARTSLANREDVLFYGMDWELGSACRLLSEETIANEKAAGVGILAVSLQALAKFGTRNDVPTISQLLDDQRPVSRARVTPQGTINNQVGDLAMAAIACISGVDLDDVGFTGVKRDPRFGFLIEEIGFPNNQPEKRATARKLVNAIVNSTPVTAPRFGR